MKDLSTDNTRMFVFDSLADFHKTPTVLDVNSGQAENSLERNKPKDWFGAGCKNGADVERLTENGWLNGLKKVEKLADSIKLNRPQSVKRKKARADQGDELDIHKVNRGELDRAWARMSRRKAGAPRIITVAVNSTINYATSEQVLFWRGAAVSRLVDIMQEAGYQTQVMMYFNVNMPFSGSSKKFEAAVYVKRPTDRLNKLALATGLCLAGSFRFYGFKAMYSAQKTERSLGHPQQQTIDYVKKSARGSLIDGTEKISDKASAEAWIEKQINKITA